MKRSAVLGFGLGVTAVCGLIGLLLWATPPVVDPAGPTPGPDRQGSGTFLAGPPADPAISAARQPASEPPPSSLASPRAVLVVRVVERTVGRPIPGAGLALEPAVQDGSQGASDPLLLNPAGEIDARADAQGECRFDVPAETAMKLRVSGPDSTIGGRSLSVAPLAPGEPREMLVDLPSGLDLEFWMLVVTAQADEPIADARIRLFAGGSTISTSEGIPRKRLFSQSSTDSGGSAQVKAPSWRGVIARVDADGFGPVLVPVVEGHGDSAHAQVVRLSRAASLSAVVLSAHGAPLAGVDVRLTVPSASVVRPEGTTLRGNDPEWSAPTDAEGRCRFEGLPPEAPLRAEILRGGDLLQIVADPLILAPGEAAERTFTVGSGARIAGMLLDPRSTPLPGVEIWLARATASAVADRYFVRGTLEKPFATSRSGADGRFAFEDVQSGSWWIGPGSVPLADAPAEDSVATRATLVRVPPEEREIEVVLRVDLGLYVRGRVLGPDGKGMPSVFVHASPEGVGGILATRSLGDGAFAVGPLARGSFRLQASGTDGSTDSDSATASAGDSDVVLRLRAGGVLRGHVLDQGTGKPCGATVLLFSDSDEHRLDTAATSRDAAFEFTGLRPGSYDLVARSEDGRVGILRGAAVPEGGENAGLVVPMTEAARLRIRYLGPASSCQFTVLSERTVVALGIVQAGTSNLSIVPKGALLVRFRGADGAEETREIDTREGDQEAVFRSN